MPKGFVNNRSCKGSLYSLVFRGYIIFVLLGVLIVLLMLYISDYFNNKYSQAPDINELLKNAQSVENTHYDSLNIDRFVGVGGYIEVLNENADIIYTSDDSKKNTYSKDTLRFIEDVNAEIFYTVEKLNGKDNVRYEVKRYRMPKEDDQMVEANGIALIDENKKIVYTNMNLGSDELSQNVLDVLLSYEDMLYLTKYKFTAPEGDTRYLLLHIDPFSRNNPEGARRITFGIFVGMIIAIVAITTMYTLKVTRMVMKPLRLLQNAMDNLRYGKQPGTPEYEGPKEFVGIFKTYDEMTARLHESEQEKEKVEADRQRMLADISHDLKTPVTVIQGYASAVADGLISEESQQQYLRIIVNKADLLSELINSFYEFSRIEHPEFELTREDGDICEYLREYLAEKYDELTLSGFDLDTDIPEEKIKYSFDHMQLKRVFENLIVNSIKHNKEGTVIYASIRKSGDKIVINIGDNGNGIPEELKSTIFDPFVVGNKSRTSGQGTGLGLAIAKKIVEAHGGTIALIDDKNNQWKTLYEIVL